MIKVMTENEIDRPSEEYKGDNSQLVAPATGMPAVTVPMGYSYGGLPAGLQILGRPYAEGRLIELAYAYEQASRHRRPCAACIRQNLGQGGQSAYFGVDHQIEPPPVDAFDGLPGRADGHGDKHSGRRDQPPQQNHRIAVMSRLDVTELDVAVDVVWDSGFQEATT